MADEALQKCNAGNDMFVDEEYDSAIKFYTEAIELDSSKSDYYLKRCNAYIKVEKFNKAVKDADMAIKLDGNSSKIHQRKGLALFSLKNFEASRESYKLALAHDQSNEQVQQWIRKCEAEMDLKKGGCTKNKFSVGLSDPCEPPVEAKKEKKDPQCISNGKEADVKQDPIPLPPAKIKHDWYQTDTHVVIAVLIRNQNKDHVNVDFTEKALSFSAKLPSGSDYSLELDLAHEIVPAQSSYRVIAPKIEVKMKKAEGIRWSSLETDNESHLTTANSTGQKVNADSKMHDKIHEYPSSAPTPKNWDRLEKEAQEEEKHENMEGDAALNKLFQQIYADGNDETKRAMNKSFQESGGTVLSTNWGEIGKEKVEIKPPDCMEYKKYEY